MANLDGSDFVLVIIAIFIPPISALITDGCGGQFCLNILLTILGWLPGAFHAVWLILRRAERETASGQRRSKYGAHHNTDNRPIYVQQPVHQNAAYPQQGYAQPPPPEVQTNYGGRQGGKVL